MQLKDLIAYLKFKNGFNTSEFARVLGVGRTTMIRWENGESKTMKEDAKGRLSQYLNIDVDQYLKYDLVKPILGVVKAGYDLTAFENIEDYIEVTPTDAMRGDYFLRVTGDSMIGSNIFPNSLIYVKSVNDVETNTIAVVLINGDEATVKRVIKKDSLLILEATNPTVSPRIFTQAEVATLPVQIIGKVLYVKHDL